MANAPVIVFAYNRPQLLEQTLSSLEQNALAIDTELFIFCDGAKPNASPEELIRIEEVRTIASRKWCKKSEVIISPTNKGLARSIIDGVTAITTKYGNAIIVEDDVLLSKHFLQFMNDALTEYANSPNIYSVGSWNYFIRAASLPESFFLRYPDSIAWATWSDKWTQFQEDSHELLRALHANSSAWNRFTAGGDNQFMVRMLKAQSEGKINSWAIRWTATVVLNNGLTLYPSQSLSKHIGFGIDASNEKSSNDYNDHVILSDHPINVQCSSREETQTAFQSWKSFVEAEFGTEAKATLRSKLRDFTPTWLVNGYRKMRYGSK